MKHTQGMKKRVALLFILALACVVLSACYMDPDRVVDNQNNGLDVGQGGFDTVITPTPAVTATPVPTAAPTSNEIDWTEWNFGDDTATNPPSNLSPTTPPIGGNNQPTVTNAPQIGTATARPTTPPTQAPTKKPSTGSTGSTTLKSGSEGSNVKRLQQRLKDLGWYTGSVDGKYGQGTEKAVRDFQAAHGLSVDGKAGTTTQNTLFGSKAKKKTASSTTARPGGGSGSATTGGNKDTSTMYTNGKTDIYLRLGSSGSQVKILQNRLIVLGYLSGTADGDFAATTEAAVIAFQKRNNIYADGVAGPDTLKKLYSPSAKKAASVAGTLGSLREGMNGAAVRTLQKDLKTLGFYNGSVDGDYGQGTVGAVIAFQQSAGLKADGVAGKGTLNAIAAALGGGSSGGGASGSKADPDVYGKTASSGGYKTISDTSKTNKSDVTALQSALSSTGYYHGSLDGDFGSGTTDAVRAYQKAKGLRVTGMAGPSTQRQLYGVAESGSYQKLRPGATGTAVKNLQYALYELKYYDGNITGTYDSATENAVMVFQEQNGLSIDGIAGQDTQRRLYSGYAIPCSM